MSTQSESGFEIDAIRERWEPRIERFKRGWNRYTTHKMGVLGLLILALFSLWALFPDVFAPHRPEWKAYIGYENTRMTAEQVSSLPHPPAFGDPFFAPLGTNANGEGVYTLLVYSASNALYIGLAAGLLSSLVGVPLGLISGFYGDTWIDETIQRIVDVMYGLPFLPFLIVCILIRGETLSLKERSYVESAKVAGASDTRIVFRHILPNVMPLAFVFLAQDAAIAILSQASLAYLGLADFTANSWGIMLENIQAHGYIYSAPWWLLPPGLAITAIAAAFYFIGFSMEDVTNPQKE